MYGNATLGEGFGSSTKEVPQILPEMCLQFSGTTVGNLGGSAQKVLILR